MFKPCRIRLIITNLITNLITTRIIIGIRRCHSPLAGAEGIMEAAGMEAAGMVAAGMAVDMAVAGMAVDMAVAGMAVELVEAGTVAAAMAAAEKFVNDGGQIHLFEPLEPRFDPGLAGLVNCVCRCSIFLPRPFFERRQRTAGMQDACKLAQCVTGATSLASCRPNSMRRWRWRRAGSRKAG
jgi:hypothetical protein